MQKPETDLFTYDSITHYHSELLGGSLSCTEAVQYYLDKIEATRKLNAFIHVYANEALEKAGKLDAQRKAGRPIGKLHGVVIAIKDVICYKDHPVSAASRILQNFNSVYNSTAVERLLKEEAIIIGHTNCDEFGMGSTNENSVYGNVLNALDQTKVPGGSSGGSAVAVQASCCMVSLGTDTGGSVRQPADFCGIIGLKPTYGRISRYGLIAYASSFDQIGIFGTTIPDVARVLEVISGPDEFDNTAASNKVDDYSNLSGKHNSPLRIAYFKEALESPALDKEISRSLLDFIERLKGRWKYRSNLLILNILTT